MTLNASFLLKGGKGAARSLVEPEEVTEQAEAEATEMAAEEEATNVPEEEEEEGESEDLELAETPGGKKEQVVGLITKLKEINGFLNSMVTYWDETASGSKAYL